MSGNENRTIDRARQCGNARFAFKLPAAEMPVRRRRAAVIS